MISFAAIVYQVPPSPPPGSACELQGCAVPCRARAAARLPPMHAAGRPCVRTWPQRMLRAPRGMHRSDPRPMQAATPRSCQCQMQRWPLAGVPVS